eukprot:TRINITY_DN39454_c0_g1_i1.p1 TRINITY_DN39454_c0_g1~~TRINITY_DN39454_c0_g1_i1.p1  ORF type:complete len:198 (+),score=58.44 TRINITY_DN39454_c0_g1_i1:127-720(+)
MGAQAWVWPASEESRVAPVRLPCPRSNNVGFMRAALSKECTLLAASATNGSLWLWSLSSSKHLMMIDGHSRVATGCSFLPGSPSLASVSSDGGLAVWDVSQAFSQCQQPRLEAGSMEFASKVKQAPKPASPSPVNTASSAQWVEEQSNKVADLYKERARVSGLIANFDGLAADVMAESQRAQSKIRAEFKSAQTRMP